MRFCGIGGISAEDADLAGVRLNETQQEFHGGGLACAVGSEQRDDLARAYGEIHIAQGANFSIVLADSFQTGHNSAGICTLPGLRFFQSCDHVGLSPPASITCRVVRFCPGDCIIAEVRMQAPVPFIT